MWGQLLLISDKKYDLDWIREERELQDAGRYFGTLSEENQKNYDIFHERFEKFYFSKDIPETYYHDLDDECIIESYERECSLYSKEHCNALLKRIENAAKKEDSKYREELEQRYAKYSKPVPTIEEYINSRGEFVVRDGKVYTTKNYIDGIFDFFSRREFSDLISKSGEHAPCLKAEEIDIEASFIIGVTLIIDDMDLSYRYYSPLESMCTPEGKQFCEKTVQTIKNLPPEKYVYSFGYHF